MWNIKVSNQFHYNHIKMGMRGSLVIHILNLQVLQVVTSPCIMKDWDIHHSQYQRAKLPNTRSALLHLKQPIEAFSTHQNPKRMWTTMNLVYMEAMVTIHTFFFFLSSHCIPSIFHALLSYPWPDHRFVWFLWTKTATNLQLTPKQSLHNQNRLYGRRWCFPKN